MRMPKYLSPSSIKTWYSDRQEFYLKYMADNRPPRIPQTQPMAAGSAFDAFVKSYLYEKVYGPSKEFAVKTIFEQQVEPQNRDWAWEHGNRIFQAYKTSGALADFVSDVHNANPRFEFTVEKNVVHERCVAGVPLLGKPDVYYVTASEACRVIRDWKVNGYCSKSNTSPKPGYLRLRDGWDGDQAKPSRFANRSHKDCQAMQVNGVTINVATFLEEVDEDWAAQLAIYAWIMGEPIGSDFIVGIDQLVGGVPTNGVVPIRVAEHRCRISAQFQLELFDKICDMWAKIQAKYIFDALTVEESDEKCQMLDGWHRAYIEDGSLEEEYFARVTRGH